MSFDRTDLQVSLLLVLLSLAVYHQTWFSEFVEWDDDVYVTNNAFVKQGLTVASVAYAWTTFDSGNYIPLTWLSYELDTTLFGVDSRFYHAVNLFLHTLNCLLLFRVLRQMTGSIGRSAVVALLFAVHPLHVESVAWISERKDVLSTCLLLLTLLAYRRYSLRPSVGTYVLVCLLFALGLLAKSMLVTLPVLLLLLDVFVLDRLRSAPSSSVETPAIPPDAFDSRLGKTPATYPPRDWKDLCLEKVPLLLLSLACAAVTVGSQGSAGAFQAVDRVPLVYRLGNAVQASGWYLMSTFWPLNLSPFYPHPLTNLSWTAVLTSALVLVAISAGVVVAGQRRPILVFGWLWFLISLLPVLGIMQVGAQAHADRYAYIPHIGLLVLIVWQVQTAICQWPGHRWVAGAMASSAIVACGVLTLLQVPVWHDTGSLWRQALRVDPDHEMGHYRLGNWIAQTRGPQPESFEHMQIVLKMGKHRDDAHYSLGWMYEAQGDLAQAAEHYRQAIQANPRHPKASLFLSALQRRAGDQQAAYDTLLKYAEFNPRGAEVWNRLGLVQIRLNRLTEAVESFARAVRADPSDVGARTNLALALCQQGEFPTAKEHLLAAVRLAPNSSDAHVNLADTLAAMGDRSEAIQHYREAVRLNPQDNEAQQRLSRLMSSP